jgi:proline iminopeptidase
MKVLYPDLDPYATHHFEYDNHKIYLEECGNPAGLPVLFLHGGPGSGCKAYHRCFFNPEKYRIILLDQRGAGRSAPQGELANNTTAALLGDLEDIRKRLGIPRWLLFGGSWGAALALLYAQEHPGEVSGLVLRGAFLARQRDLRWFVEDGANRIYPEPWCQFLDSIPEAERDRPVECLYRHLTGEDELARRRAAKAWALWSGQVVLGDGFDPTELNSHVSAQVVNQARIELHYAVNRYFIEENRILDRCDGIGHLPAILIHGRRDLTCPVESSFSLHRKLPNSKLWVLPNAGHVPSGGDMIDALVSAADRMAERLTP